MTRRSALAAPNARFVVAAFLAAGCAVALMAGSARGAEVLPPTEKVVVCHASNNGFARIEVDVNSIVKGTGHGGHANDIIPPFRYRLSPKEDVQRYPGRNWDEAGEAIWANGCARPQPPEGAIEVFACVDDNGATFDATFGYNSSAGPVTIQPGPQNGFSPPPVDRGQVRKFSDGYVLAAFTVRGVVEPALTWTVAHGGRTSSVTANRSSPPCSIQPSPEPDVPIGIFVTCVTNHGGSYDAVFGYDSDNRDPATIPVGAANRFSPAPADRGQPTTFRPGREREAVRVRDIPRDVALTWTLAFVDTRTATATADFDGKCAEPPAPRPFGIFASCVTRDGPTYDATFGYVNEKLDALRIPIGPRNFVSPGRADQGQPSTFEPGFVDAAFTVRGIPAARSVTWRVRLDGEARVATADTRLPECITAPIRPVPEADVSKSVAPLTAILGERVTTALVLRNRGSAVLRPAGVVDVLEGPQRVVSARTTRGRCRVTPPSGAQRVRCSSSTLAPGASLRVRIVTTTTAPGTARDRASYIGRPRDRSPRNNADRAAVRILPTRPPGLG